MLCMEIPIVIDEYLLQSCSLSHQGSLIGFEALYSNENMVMKAYYKHIIEEVRKTDNDKGGNFNYVEPFLQLLYENLRGILMRNTCKGILMQ